MKLKKEFINAVISNQMTNASQWQLAIETIQSNYVLVTDLLKEEQVLYSEVTTRCQEFQGQLIHMLAQFIHDMDELEENSPNSNSGMSALFERHIQRMSELNGHIHAFVNSLRLPSQPV